MFLILTNEKDITSDYIVRELEKRSLPYYRLNSENLPNSKVSFTPDLGWKISYNNKVLSFSDVTAAYFRRPGEISLPASVTGYDEQKYCLGEWNTVLLSAINSIENKWLNSPKAIYSAEDKPMQLFLAKEIGFYIPESLITNDAKLASGFTNGQACIAKPLKVALLDETEQEKVIFTNKLPRGQVFPDETLSLAPIILQTEIKKECDIRVTVVGDKVFATKILSQSTEETKVDWRRGEHVDLIHQACILPEEIEEKCITLTRKLNLRFGAIDLILDQQGVYWFLEINPNGQWAWIENRTQSPLSSSIVDELERISNA
ncbi:MvdC/MvdD family ATP grasp protein [Terasakiella pusilla]|uniref:MvdC/MvdD family ATP grasp protein n=1 Tax=Terasakiella pusilla TaxID=64973 RepID=UPI00048BFC06|nr:hypothetical protein [Terasakiella pusilla]